MKFGCNDFFLINTWYSRRMLLIYLLMRTTRFILLLLKNIEFSFGLYRHIFEHKIKERRKIDEETYTSKRIRDGHALLVYKYLSTVILFIDLLDPFSINLLSSMFVIIGSARRRAEAQNPQTYRQHLHKHLAVSPIILVLPSNSYWKNFKESFFDFVKDDDHRNNHRRFSLLWCDNY